VTLPAPNTKGLRIIEAELLEGDKVRAIYHSGFWIRDEEYLHSGPRMTVNNDYFEMDGKPLAVVGTTYMSARCSGCISNIPTSTCGIKTWPRFTLPA